MVAVSCCINAETEHVANKMRQVIIKCRYCDILLAGREQFIGHMIHAHEMVYDTLETTWQLIGQQCAHGVTE